MWLICRFVVLLYDLAVPPGLTHITQQVRQAGGLVQTAPPKYDATPSCEEKVMIPPAGDFKRTQNGQTEQTYSNTDRGFIHLKSTCILMDQILPKTYNSASSLTNTKHATIHNLGRSSDDKKAELEEAISELKDTCKSV